MALEAQSGHTVAAGTCDCNLRAQTNDVSSTYECRETHNEWPRNEHVN